MLGHQMSLKWRPVNISTAHAMFLVCFWNPGSDFRIRHGQNVHQTPTKAKLINPGMELHRSSSFSFTYVVMSYPIVIPIRPATVIINGAFNEH